MRTFSQKMAFVAFLAIILLPTVSGQRCSTEPSNNDVSDNSDKIVGAFDDFALVLKMIKM